MCSQCEVMTINGVKCHEKGCPNEKFEPRECKWCPETFTPQADDEQFEFCSNECWDDYYG